jgi:hypothetical protein
MNKIIYDEKKTYLKYDDTHYVCYLNEEREELPAVSGMGTDQGAAEPEPEASLGYAYTGNLPDGGTLVEAPEDAYDAFLSGLIRVEYPQSRVEAIQANRMTALLNPNHKNAAQYADEWNALQSHREWSKKQVKTLLGIESVRTLTDAVSDKLAALAAFDSSPEVNSFLIGGMPCWIPAGERAEYDPSIGATERANRKTIVVPLAGQLVEVPVEQARVMLDAIQLYAGDAAIVTARHAAAIAALESIEEVDAYDFTTGYPEKITFDLPL